MKRWMLVLSMLGMALTMGTPVNAAEEGGQFSFSASTQMWSRYLNQGGGIQYDGPVLWSSIFVTHKPTGLYAGVWNSTPTDGTRFNSNFGSENDLYLGWRDRTGNVGYTLGVAYFDLYQLGGDANADLMMAAGEMNYHFVRGSHEFIPFVRVEYVTPPPVPNPVFNSSLRGLIGVGYTFTLDNRTSLSAKLWMIGDDGRNLPEPAGIAQLDLGLRFKLSNNISADLGTKLSQPVSNSKTSTRKFEVVPWLGLNFRF